MPVAGKAASTMVSHTGVPLTRATTFRFTLNVTPAQHQALLSHAGAARLAFNHHLARVKANLDQRSAERSYGVCEADLTPPLSGSKVSFINYMNAWKDGRDPSARVNADGSRGLGWRGEVSADVFETASVNAAQALANWWQSRTGARAGRAAGFPRFKSRSNGRAKAARRLGRVHARVANLRSTWLHQVTSELAKQCSTVVVEDLNVAGMVQNRRLARHVCDAAFGELRRQLTYKTAWYGTQLVVADRWYPSSKTCSSCGAVNAELSLSDRVYTCPCRLVLDRDVNAAINLARWTPTPHDLPLPASA